MVSLLSASGTCGMAIHLSRCSASFSRSLHLFLPKSTQSSSVSMQSINLQSDALSEQAISEKGRSVSPSNLTSYVVIWAISRRFLTLSQSSCLSRGRNVFVSDTQFCQASTSSLVILRTACTTGLRTSAKKSGLEIPFWSRTVNRLASAFSVRELLAGESTIENGMRIFSLWSNTMLIAVR